MSPNKDIHLGFGRQNAEKVGGDKVSSPQNMPGRVAVHRTQDTVQVV